jgi:integrase
VNIFANVFAMGSITRFAPDERGKPRVSVFRRGTTFYARFRLQNKTIAGGKLYITETLKTSSEQEANQKAYERLLEIRLAEKSGSSLNKDTVAEAIDAFIAEYEDRLQKGLSGYSAHMLRSYRKTICRYWKDYVGKKSLGEVLLSDMEAYEHWRASYWQNWIDEQKKKKRGSTPIRLHSDGSVRLPYNARLQASNRTVGWEINAFKSFLVWAKRKGLYVGDADLFVFKNGRSSRRSAFTQQEYNRITSVMRRKSWLSEVGKHKNDPRLSRYRKMLRAYVLFLANTGLRVGESRNLRWQDITFTKNAHGEEICKVWVTQSHSKVKKRREVSGMAKAAEVIRELAADRKSKNDFCQPHDFVWCDETGRVIGDFREGFNSLMKTANAELDSDRKKHTVYCLRHFYITEKLRDGIPIYEIASNTGTSVSMIEKYYSDARPSDFMDRLTKSRYPKRQPLS